MSDALKKITNKKITSEDVQIEELDVRGHSQYMDHERVFKMSGPQITAFVGVHNTALGPALGGIRYKDYVDGEAALHDALRLSEAMTWKNSGVGLHHGGGKSTIMAVPGEPKPSDETLRLFAAGLDLINAKKPLYYGAQDMNISEAAIDTIAQHTKWVLGRTSDDERIVGGTPSPLTAMAVVECIKLAAQYKLGRQNLEGVTISLQGLGTVGGEMARLLAQEGALLKGCDPHEETFAHLAVAGVAVEKVALEDIYDAPADIFAPNAIGGILTDANIERLEKAGVQVVCGAANNQQEDQAGGSQSKLMLSKGILYSPDYIVNAGGVFWVAEEGKDAQETRDYIRTQVAAAFQLVLELHDQSPDTDLATIARQMAEKRVAEASGK